MALFIGHDSFLSTLAQAVMCPPNRGKSKGVAEAVLGFDFVTGQAITGYGRWLGLLGVVGAAELRHVRRLPLPVRAADDTPAARLRLNQAAGNAARDRVLAMQPGARWEVPLQTPDGMRRIDVLTSDAVAIEVKVGQVRPSTRIMRQVLKDVHLRDNPEVLDVMEVRWQFFRSEVTGEIGPTDELAEILDFYGISFKKGEGPW